VRRGPGPAALWAAADNPPRVVGSIRGIAAGRPILLPARPLHFDVSPNEAQAAVALESQEVAIVDLAAGRLSHLVRLGSELGQVRFRSDGRAVIAADLGRRMIAVLDPGLGRVTVELRWRCARTAVDETGRRAGLHYREAVTRSRSFTLTAPKWQRLS